MNSANNEVLVEHFRFGWLFEPINILSYPCLDLS